MENHLTLQLATKTDIDCIKELAYDIWHAHYIDIIGLEQVEYMLSKMYSTDSILNQMIEEKQEFYMINQQNQSIGFVSVSTKNNNDYFIHKFYINQSIAGKGIGSEVLHLLTDLKKPITYQLTVNRQNYKSINFYFKNGFVIDKVADFDIGNGFVMNDFIMKSVISK